MKIAIVAKLWERTDPRSTGGTGVSIGNLVNGLVGRGHHITLYATGDSKTRAQKLVSVRPRPYAGDYSELHEYENIAAAFRDHARFDLIHCAVEHKSVIFGGLTPTPSLHSIRYGEFFAQEKALLKKHRQLDFVANSRALIERYPFLNWRGYVHNGIDADRFPYQGKPGGYLLFLGRVTPQKGADIAIAAAKRTGKRLIIAGKTEAVDREYLDQRVFPLVDGKQIIYLGPVGFRAKLKLLRHAGVLLHPNRVFEACSNTLLEAMACGTPAVAFDRGSNRELIEPGVSGYLVRTEAALAGAIAKALVLGRARCRSHVRKNFSIERMVEGYERIYASLIAARKRKQF